VHRPTSRNRLVAVLASAALAVGAAGCGGSDGGGGGDAGATSYASTWNDVCSSLTAAQTALQKRGADAAGTSTADKAELGRIFAKGASEFADSLIAALERVKDLDAPDEFSAFQTRVSKAAPSVIEVLRSVKAPLARGDVAATQAALGKIDPKSLVPAIPAGLKQQATACNLY
jgi:hypothetical protein